MAWITLGQADAYFQGTTYNDQWVALGNDREDYIKRASQRLENLPFRGDDAYRTTERYTDGLVTGTLSDYIPVTLISANSELALWYSVNQADYLIVRDDEIGTQISNDISDLPLTVQTLLEPFLSIRSTFKNRAVPINYDNTFVVTTDEGGGTLPTGDISLDDLDDVVINSPTFEQTLQFDGVNWVNAGFESWQRINGNFGTTIPNVPNDTLNINGGTEITTSITGDTVTINFTGDIPNSISDLPNDAGYLTDVSNQKIGDLLNVNDSGVSINQVLTFNGSTWVNAPAQGGLGDAPSDSLIYGRRNGAWEQVTGGSGGWSGTATSNLDMNGYVIWGDADNGLAGITSDGNEVSITATTGNNVVIASDGNPIYSLPNISGSIGQVLTTDGVGNATWETAQSGGASTLDSLLDVSVPSPVSGDYLAWDENNQKWIGKRSQSALGFVDFAYDMLLPPSATPLNGDLSRDNTSPAITTKIYINKLDKSGSDISLFLDFVEAGNWLNFHLDSDTEIFEQYDITGPAVLVGDVFEVPVTYFNNQGTLANNNDLKLFIRYVSDTTGGVPDAPIDGTPYGRQSSGWVNVATAAQGTLANTATQPGDNISLQVNDAGYVTTSGVTSVVGGQGITVTNSSGPTTTVSNTDLGSSQSIFKNVAVSGQNTIVADSNNDTLTFAAGTGVTLTTNNATDTITINSTASGGGWVGEAESDLDMKFYSLIANTITSQDGYDVDILPSAGFDLRAKGTIELDNLLAPINEVDIKLTSLRNIDLNMRNDGRLIIGGGGASNYRLPNTAGADGEYLRMQPGTMGDMEWVAPPISSDTIFGGFKHTFVGGVLNLITE